MPTISRTALVPYSPQQMYRLVDDIKSYPKFLPWCGDAQEIMRDDDKVEASVTIAKGAVHKTFATRNLLQKNKIIEMKLIDGPFKHLNGFWRFEDIKGQACKVSLDLEFEFSNKLVSMAIGPIFNQIANTLVDAFVDRAKQSYDK